MTFILLPRFHYLLLSGSHLSSDICYFYGRFGHVPVWLQYRCHQYTSECELLISWFLVLNYSTRTLSGWWQDRMGGGGWYSEKPILLNTDWLLRIRNLRFFCLILRFRLLKHLLAIYGITVTMKTFQTTSKIFCGRWQCPFLPLVEWLVDFWEERSAIALAGNISLVLFGKGPETMDVIRFC